MKYKIVSETGLNLMQGCPLFTTGKKVIGFYGHSNNADYCCFSNFYEHNSFEFEVPEWCGRAELWDSGRKHVTQIHFTEKAIMLCKAALMKDYQRYDDIVKATSPRDCKRLGRKVSPWNDDLWNKFVCSIARAVILQKAKNVPIFLKKLTLTGDSILAEATKSDRIWGIGLNVSDINVQNPNKWRGSNILGWALMEIRQELAST